MIQCLGKQEEERVYSPAMFGQFLLIKLPRGRLRYACMYVYICTYVCVHNCVCMCVYIYMCVCVCLSHGVFVWAVLECNILSVTNLHLCMLGGLDVYVRVAWVSFALLQW